jgi:hypothetical protein
MNAVAIVFVTLAQLLAWPELKSTYEKATMEGSNDMWTAPEEVIAEDEAQADEEFFF